MKTWSIGAKLALQVTVAIVIVMVTIGVLGMYQQERKFTDILDTRAEWITEQCAMALVAPIWTMDNNQIGRLLQSFLSNSDILAIKLTEGGTGTPIWHQGKDLRSSSTIDFTEGNAPLAYPDSFTRQISIDYEDESIGQLQIAFSRQFITAQMHETFTLLGIGLFALIAVEIIILLILVKRNISDPLAANVRAAAQIANGNIEVQLADIRSHDEIGSLNTAFRNMVAYLHQMAAGATQISAGELDREFAPKSQHDVLGNAFHQMTDYLQTMAATAIAGGDLRQEVQPRSERDVLGNAFQQMAFLRQIIGQVTEGSLHLEKASESLKQMSLQMAGDAQQASKQSHGISNNTQQVNRHVAAVAAAMNESAITIGEITTNTRQVADIATEAMQIAQNTDVVMGTLANRSREIGKIVDLITGIAKQINLLALDASIEASRSGEAGRRFAVVAAEVKELANKTTQSADDISHLIGGIQHSSGESTDAIHKLSTIVQRIDQLTATIATAVEEQNSTQLNISESLSNIAGSGEETTRAMGDFAGVSDHISELATSVQQASQELDALSGQMQQAVEHFKI
jgi:methyl-accepting chemotaxis protein